MKTLSSPPSWLFFEPRTAFGVKISADLQCACEQMALCTVLARLDLRAWRDEMKETWNGLVADADAAYMAKTPFAFGVEASMKELPMLRDWSTSSQITSDAYEKLIERAAALVDTELGTAPVCVHVRFVLDGDRSGVSDAKRLTKALKKIVNQVEAMKNQPRTSSSICPVFVIQEVHIESADEYTNGLLASDEALACMEQLLACGILIRGLPAIQSRDRIALFETVQRLMPSHGSTSSFPGIATLAVSDSAPWEANLAILSALVDSRSTHQVCIQYSECLEGASLRKFWHWVAFALFSREARHNVAKLHFQSQAVPVEYVEMMREVLEAEDPLAVLMEETRDRAVDDAWVSATQFSMAPFVAGSDVETTSQALPRCESLVVRTIKKSVGGWWVLLPGYGKAYVYDRDACVVREDAATRPSLVRPSLDVVCLHSDVVAIFRTMGERVRTIELNDVDLSEWDRGGRRGRRRGTRKATSQCMTSLLTSCPRLEELHMRSVSTDRLSVFVDTPGAPRLRKLTIQGPSDEAIVFSRSVVAFFEALCDASHPLASSLTVLKLSFQLVDDDCERFIEMVRRLLDHNRRLYSIFLYIIADVESRKEVDEVARLIECGFEAFVQDKSVVVAIPLAVESKWAFVGVLSRLAGCDRLDSGVASTIFEFAGQTRTREFEYYMA